MIDDPELHPDLEGFLDAINEYGNEPAKTPEPVVEKPKRKGRPKKEKAEPAVVVPVVQEYTEYVVPFEFTDHARKETTDLGTAPRTGEVIAFDIETNAKHYKDPDLRITLLALDNGSPVVPVFRGQAILAGIEILRQAEALGATIVGYNSSAFDRAVIEERTGINIKCDDAYLLEHLLSEDTKNTLQATATRRLNVAPWKDVLDFPWDVDLSTLTPEQWNIFAQYCSRDTRYTRMIYLQQREEINADPLLRNYYETLFMPLSRALSRVERNGVFISLEAIGAHWGREALLKTKAELTMKKIAGEKFESGSPLQVGKVLFGPESKFKLPPQKLTPKGKASTDEGALKKTKYALVAGEVGGDVRAEVTAFVDALLVSRKADKLINTYYQPFAEYAIASPQAPRIFPSYYLTGSVSRSAASDPPIQTTPRIGFEHVVQAAPGHVLIHADFSQMELRIAAHLSQDPNMLAAFRNGDDLHRLLAQRVLGRTEITKEERSRMKPVNFGFLFDADPYTYEQTMLTDYDIVVPRSESKMLHAAFHSQWAGLRPWYTRTVSTAFDQGYVRAEDGRVRRVQNMRSENPREQQNARRQIINFPVQELGLTLGGLMVILATGNGLKVVRFVHDSCDVEVLDDPQHIENAATIFKRMEQVIPQILKSKFGIEFSVPIIIDVEVMGR